MATRIKLRRGTALQWASANPVLSLGEFGYESNTTRFKIGDGATDWNSLDYNEQIITLSGDVSGSGNGLIQVTVNDDSHNHTTATLPNFTEDVQDVVGGMVESNSESGISVTYDDENGKLNFDVNDPIITLEGDVAGSATITNLGNTTINVTIQPDSVSLGTDTTGDYIETITGTENQVVVTGEGTEGRDVILSLPQDIHFGAVPQFAGLRLPESLTATSSANLMMNSVPIVVDSFDADEFTTVDYIVQISQGTKNTSFKMMVTWDGADIHVNEYSIIDGTLGAANATLTPSIDENNVISIEAESTDAGSNPVTIKSAITRVSV
jgi:hypothetical protein